MSEKREDTDRGPDLLTAYVYGDSITAMKMAALDEARVLYGPDARLTVEGIGGISTTLMPSVAEERGRFRAVVQVRCLDYADD
jgi:hypothetical protein